MCILGALQRQVDLQGVFVKIGDFIKFKGFLVEFLKSRRSWENQKPPENRQKSGLFWASPFTMHLVWTLLETMVNSRRSLSRDKISKFSEINSWKHFSGSAIILFPTVHTALQSQVEWTWAEDLDHHCSIHVHGSELTLLLCDVLGQHTCSHSMIANKIPGRFPLVRAAIPGPPRNHNKCPHLKRGWILFREYCFGREISLSSAANAVSSAGGGRHHLLVMTLPFAPLYVLQEL